MEWIISGGGILLAFIAMIVVFIIGFLTGRIDGVIF
jgi:hypothetical protein